MKTRVYFTPTLTKGKTTFKSGKNGSEELKVLCQGAEVAGHQMNKRIDPRIFHKNTAEDYLRAAIETANWIDTLAVKTEHGRIWKALPEGQDGYREDVPMFTSKSMYDGSAGIGIFLIRLYEATSDERWLKEAEEATASGGQDQIESELQEPMPEHEKQSDQEKRKTGGSLRPQRRNRSFQEASAEVQSDAQA